MVTEYLCQHVYRYLIFSEHESHEKNDLRSLLSFVKKVRLFCVLLPCGQWVCDKSPCSNHSPRLCVFAFLFPWKFSGQFVEIFVPSPQAP